MTFPMQALTYGLRRRLHELATPCEVLTLQVAAPYYYGLQPMQQFRSVDTVTIKMVDNNIVVKGNNGATEVNVADGLIDFHGTLEIHDFNLVESVDLSNFKLAPKFINLFGCYVSKELVSSIAAQTLQTVKPVTWLRIDSTSVFESDDVVKMLCSAPLLAPLETVYINDACGASLNCWLGALIETSHPFVRGMFWEDATLETLQLNKYIFERLFRLQNDNFELNIYFNKDARIVKVRKQLAEFFDHAFDFSRKSYSPKRIKISYGPRGREYEFYYYLRD